MNKPLVVYIFVTLGIAAGIPAMIALGANTVGINPLWLMIPLVLWIVNNPEMMFEEERVLTRIVEKIYIWCGNEAPPTKPLAIKHKVEGK